MDGEGSRAMFPELKTEFPPRAGAEAERRHRETLAHVSLFL
jgi:hypothetical protein